MPIYEFACRACESRFEELVKVNGFDPSADCPHCGSRETERLLSVFAVGKAPVAGQPRPAQVGGGPGGCCGGACGCH